MSRYNSEEWYGRKFGMLTVIGFENVTTSNGGHQWFWRTLCECGTESTQRPSQIIRGRTKSCGCYKKIKPCPTKTHNESRTRLHNIWCSINDRCNPRHKDSRGYGSRGIRICDEWRDYMKFAEWARANGYADNLTIERKDVNGNYCPENCTWIPLAKQARNRRTTHWVEFDGKKMSLAEACEIAGLPYKQVFFRYRRAHWSLDKALSVPMGGPVNSPIKHRVVDLSPTG